MWTFIWKINVSSLTVEVILRFEYACLSVNIQYNYWLLYMQDYNVHMPEYFCMNVALPKIKFVIF